MSPSAHQCARHLLDTAPIVMRFIHGHIRRRRMGGLSLVQFRALGFLSRTNNASLSAAADHLGLSLPAMSRLIEALVARDLVKRRTKTIDRRQVALTITRRGQRLLGTNRTEIRRRLAAALRTLSARDRTALDYALVELHQLFGSQSETA